MSIIEWSIVIIICSVIGIASFYVKSGLATRLLDDKEDNDIKKDDRY
jgi:hypothetical protein